MCGLSCNHLDEAHRAFGTFCLSTLLLGGVLSVSFPWCPRMMRSLLRTSLMRHLLGCKVVVKQRVVFFLCAAHTRVFPLLISTYSAHIKRSFWSRSKQAPPLKHSARAHVIKSHTACVSHEIFTVQFFLILQRASLFKQKASYIRLVYKSFFVY